MNHYKTNEVLSTLWIFAVVNYIFCDVFTLHYAPDLNLFLTGRVGGIELTQEFLLTFAIIMQIPMSMIVLTKFLPYRINRYLNIGAGSFMAVLQTATLTLGSNTLHYVFFSIVEVATTVVIVGLAIRWKETVTNDKGFMTSRSH